MANRWGNDIAVCVDVAAGTTSRITAWTNQASIQGAIDILDQTGFGNTTPDIMHGISRVTIPLNGFVNSTTEAIWGPLLVGRTSVSKTCGFYNGLKWYKGEFFPDSVEFSGTPDSLQTWSVNLLSDGAITRSSTAPA